MASSKEYLDFVMEQLSGLTDVTYRPMMGEFIIYCRGIVVGGIYDNRFLVKPVQSAIDLMPEPVFELPYHGGKEMLLVEDVEDRELMAGLINALYEELKNVKRKKK